MSIYDDFKKTLRLIYLDYKQYGEPFLYLLFFGPGFKYSFHHRLCYFFRQHKVLFFPLYVMWMLYLKHLTYLVGIQTASNKQLPERFCVAHFGGITFFPEKCGSGVYLRQGVTVGNRGRTGDRHPILGDNIEFGANAVVIGPITVGNNVTIGANSVVTKDVPDNVVVAGAPARIIKRKEQK